MSVRDYRNLPSTTDNVKFAQEQVMASFHDRSRINMAGGGWGGEKSYLYFKFVT